MEWYDYIGIVAGLASLFFGFCAFFLYMKVRKLFSLLTEEQLKEAEEIILQQNKKIKLNTIFCVVLGILAVAILLFTTII